MVDTTTQTDIWDSPQGGVCSAYSLIHYRIEETIQKLAKHLVTDSKNCKTTASKFKNFELLELIATISSDYLRQQQCELDDLEDEDLTRVVDILVEKNKKRFREIIDQFEGGAYEYGCWTDDLDWIEEEKNKIFVDHSEILVSL